MSATHAAQLILAKPLGTRRCDVEVQPLRGSLDEVFGDRARAVARPVGRRIDGTTAIVGVVARVPQSTVAQRALHPRQMDAAALLVGGMLVKNVAQALGVAEETVTRWKRRPDFQAAMKSMLQERLAATQMAMVSLCQDAVEELRCLIHGSNDMTRLRAIELVLGTVSRGLSVVPPGIRAGGSMDDTD
jgi:hypothetical protein